MTTIEFTEEERQFILLALAQISLINPGTDYFANTIALKLDKPNYLNRSEMYETFRQARQKEPRWGVYDHYKKEWVTDEVPWEGTYTEATSKQRTLDDKDGRRFYEVQRLPEKTP